MINMYDVELNMIVKLPYFPNLIGKIVHRYSRNYGFNRQVYEIELSDGINDGCLRRLTDNEELVKFNSVTTK